MAKNRRVSGKSAASPGAKGFREANPSDVRARQVAIAEILNKLFGPMNTRNTSNWCRRTHLQLVGMIFARLASNEEDMSTGELVRYSKMLVEQRRLDAEAGASPKGKPKPKVIENALQKLYGADGTPRTDTQPA